MAVTSATATDKTETRAGAKRGLLPWLGFRERHGDKRVCGENKMELAVIVDP